MHTTEKRERTEAEPRTAPVASGGVRILTVIDGSEHAGHAIDYVLDLAQELKDITFTLLAVVAEPADERLRGYGSFKREEVRARLKDVLGRRAIAAATHRFERADVSFTSRIEVGAPAATILRVASEEKCDLIFISEAPAGSFSRWLGRVFGLCIATVATQVAQSAPMPVTIIK